MKQSKTILIIENDDKYLDELSRKLKSWNYETLAFRHPADSFQLIAQFPIVLVIANLKLPETDGLTYLQEIKKRLPNIPRIIIADQADKSSLLQAINTVGLDAFLEKPIKDEDLRLIINNCVEGPGLLKNLRIKNQAYEKRNTVLTRQNKEFALQNIELINFMQRQTDRYPDLIGGQAEAMQTLLKQIEAISKIDGPVLISGEHGSGKELAAKLIYRNSLRQRHSFFTVDCLHLPERVLEIELFGTASDDDNNDREKCSIELSHRGTLLLKSIDSMPKSLQKHLLVFMKTNRLPGGKNSSEVDYNVRILATTAQNLREQVKNNEFSEELFYELTLIPLSVPALRERLEDIPLLIKHFINVFNENHTQKIIDVDPSLIKFCQRQKWPGNVRELRQVINQMCYLCKSDQIRFADLPPEYRREIERQPATEPELSELITLDDYDRNYIRQVINACHGNRSKAARILGMKRTTLLFRLKKLGID